MYRFVFAGSLAIIVGLSIFFNSPYHDGIAQQQPPNQQPIAPEFVGISGTLNTPSSSQSISLSSLHGVVLVHLFRIGCYECQQDMPFVVKMYQKYHGFGLTMIGIQSAQFDYEKDVNNVKQFIGQYGIKFPVLMDNQRMTFQEYGDMGFPRDALVNNGHIVFTNLGSGNEYNREMAIRQALALKNY